MLKRKVFKIIFVLACIIAIMMPYASIVMAVALTHNDNTAELEVIRVHEGGEEASGTLTTLQQSLYDTTPYAYRVGETRVFKIITKGDSNYENTFYCLNAEKSFPGVSNGTYQVEAYTNVADLKDPTLANVKSLHLSTSNLGNNVTWNANYKSLIWLIDNMYLSKQTPEQKDDYLSKAFAISIENGIYTLETIKALLTDDDIDVVQQYAIWYFTNGDVDKYDVENLPAIELTKYEIEMTEDGVQTKETTGSYGDFTPSNFQGELSYSLRQDLANELYKYLISSAMAGKKIDTKYPAVDYDFINSSAKTEFKDGYYVTGPLRITSGTAASTEYTIKLVDKEDKEISRENYEILIEGESSFTNQNLNEIFDKNYYIYIAENKTEIDGYTLRLNYSSYETKASLWKNSKTNTEGAEIYQPVTLVTREKTPYTHNVNVEIERKTADLALRKYIVQINNNILDRAPYLDVSELKNGTSKTAIYKQTKSPIEVSVGDTIIYEIRVYNEGDIAGKVSSIIDSLPKGLELAENNEINSIYGWTEIVENRINSKKYVSTYLKDRTISAFDKTTGELSSNYVQIACTVTSEANPASVLTNIAEIGEDNITDRDSNPSNNTYIRDDLNSQNYTGDRENKTDLSDKNYYYKGIEDDDDFEKVIVKGKIFDLSLQKFITKINKNAPTTTRVPKVDVSELKAGTTTNATYTTVKNPETVKKGDIITYTLRIYNEGEISGYAEEVVDYLPSGLGFLVNHTTNIDNYWSIPTECTTVKLSTIENGKDNLSIEDFKEISSLDEAEVVVGKAKLTSTKLKSVETDNKNLLEGFDKQRGTTLDYRDIQIVCIVLDEKSENSNFKNIAEITKQLDENRQNVPDIDSTPNTVVPDNYPGNDLSQDDNDYEDLITEEPKEFDLSLQKFITKLNGNEIKDRTPIITKNADGTLRFNHTSEALSVSHNDLVTFTIRVYNEGDLAGYAKEVVDYLSNEGLEFVVSNSTNQKYGWKLYDANGNVTDKLDQAVTVRTKYLSKEESEKRNANCLIKPFDKTKDINLTNPDYEEIQIVFKVTAKVSNETKDSTAKRQYINKAEIYNDEDENGNSIDDIDSIPNNRKEAEDDIDNDKVCVKYFDLRLKKDLVKIIIIEDGQTREVNVANPDSLHKVEIHRKKVEKTIVKFVYKITVTNEGEIDGYATEIKDYIPEGLEFIAEENKGWTKMSGNMISTNALSETLLKPGQSASVLVTLKWKNGDNNLGVKTNVAEISEDKNESKTPDIDSTPNNKKDGEDDIDKAEVMLTISTGVVKPRYMWLVITVLSIWTTGIILIKKYVL